MAFCTQCGAKLNDGLKFCTNCGAKMDDAPAQTAVPQLTQATIQPVVPPVSPLVGGIYQPPEAAPVKKGGDASAAPAEKTEGESAPAASLTMGEAYELFADTFLVNLVDPGGSRCLKITISVEGREQADSKKKKAAAGRGAESLNNPKIKDAVITILSSKTFQEISTAQGKTALKQELQRRFNSILNPHIQVTGIYFTEFVAQ